MRHILGQTNCHFCKWLWVVCAFAFCVSTAFRVSAQDFASAPWPMELPDECVSIEGSYLVTGLLWRDGSEEFEDAKVYNTLFPFINVARGSIAFTLELRENPGKVLVELLDSAGEVIDSTEFLQASSCHNSWTAFSSLVTGGGDGSSLRKAETQTFLTKNADGSLIARSEYRIVRSKWIFFSDKDVLGTWYQFKAAE